MGMARTAGAGVLIVGAGPAGLSAAAGLARYGVACEVVDARPEPVPGTRCCTVWQRTLEIFDVLGMPVGPYAARAIPLRRKVFHHRALDEVLVADVTDPALPWPEPLLIPQEQTEAMMTDHLARLGVTVRRGVTATLRDQDAGGVTVELSDTGGTRTARYDWLVAADGADSRLRERLGVAWPVEPVEGITWVQTDARVGAPLELGRDEEHLFNTTGGHAGFVPLPDGRHRLFLALSGAGPHDERDLSADEFAAAAGRAAGVAMTLGETGGAWRTRPYGALAGTFRVGRCLLAGESARVYPLPVHGFNTGVQDGFDLAWKLAAVYTGAGPQWLLDTYEQERRPAARTVIDRTRRVLGFGTFGSSGEAERTLRGRIREKKLEIRTEPAASYRHSRLTADHGGAAGPPAGEPAPAARFAAAEGDVRLLDLLRDGRWLLLGFAGDDPAAEPVTALRRWAGKHEELIRTAVVASAGAVPPGDLRDISGEAHRRFGVTEPCAYLIRPDGYTGLRAPLHDLEPLDRYVTALRG